MRECPDHGYDRIMTEKRIRGYAPRVGLDIARTWATAYGSAWVLASDVMEPPGVFSSYAKFQVLVRALERCGIPLEMTEYDSKAYLYRLAPHVVQSILYGDQQ